MCKKILVVGPGPKARGGISAVIANYQSSSSWKEIGFKWFATCTDTRTKLGASWFQAKQYILYIWILVFQRPKAVSIHTASNNSFYRKFFYILVSWIRQVPIILHIHPAFFYNFYASRGLVTRTLIRVAARMSDRVIFLTEPLRDRFKPIFVHTTLDVLPNPVDTSAFEFSSRPSMVGNYQILFLGWIVKEKGVCDILSAIPIVLERFSKARFIFAGPKEVIELRECITSKRLQDNAEVTGWVEGQEKHALLINSRLLLLPTYTEGVPNVLLEAMAAGLPAITTAVGGIPTIFTEGVNGRFVSPGDPDGLAAAIISLLNDDEACETMSGATRENAVSKFDIEIIGERLLKVYQKYV